MNEQPVSVVENDNFTFMFSVNLPQFEKISRTTIKNDVVNFYNTEKNNKLAKAGVARNQ